MFVTTTLYRWALDLLIGCAIACMALPVSIVAGSFAPADAQPAMSQSSDDMQAALKDYGSWRPHPRYGQVWAPAGVPRDWQPYENGHWVYTDDWGWYWVSDEAEEDWGWVTYHYGRWTFERGFGWFWVPGDEWAPAWVDWRYGDDYIGWAPLPPDDLIDSYDTDPAPWIFVPGRYMTAPRLRNYYVPQDRRAFALRSTRLVNRTVAVHGARLAVNPGISPAFVAAVTKMALPSYRVRPRVFGSTQGVSGAVQVKATDLRGARSAGANGRTRVNAVAVQRTSTLIQPATSAAKPEALAKGAVGHLGSHPPRAAQGAAQQQQQSPAQNAPVPVAPPAGLPLPNGPAPITGPAIVPSPPRSGPIRIDTPPPPPPPGNLPAAHTNEPPQARPERPIVPQTPPPPPPAQLAPRQPPPVMQPAPPAHPVAPPPPPPVVKQAPPPPPPPPPVKQAPPAAAAKPAVPVPKPGEKPPEPPK